MGNVNTIAKQRSQLRGVHGRGRPKKAANRNGNEKKEPALTEEQIVAVLEANEPEWYVSAEQKKLLRECWYVLQHSIESVGTVTFLKMFETHPETLRTFIPEVERLQELELNEWYRENLKVHAIRVMAVIEKTMHRLDDEVKAAKILMSYGERHQSYGVTKQMLGKMAASFLIAIQPALEDRWNHDLEESWLALFRRLTFFMGLGYGTASEATVTAPTTS